MRWLFDFLKQGVKRAILEGVAEAVDVLDAAPPETPPLIPEALKRRLALPAAEEPEESNGKKKGAAK